MTDYYEPDTKITVYISPREALAIAVALENYPQAVSISVTPDLPYNCQALELTEAIYLEDFEWHGYLSLSRHHMHIEQENTPGQWSTVDNTYAWWFRLTHHTPDFGES